MMRCVVRLRSISPSLSPCPYPTPPPPAAAPPGRVVVVGGAGPLELARELVREAVESGRVILRVLPAREGMPTLTLLFLGLGLPLRRVPEEEEELL